MAWHRFDFEIPDSYETAFATSTSYIRSCFIDGLEGRNIAVVATRPFTLLTLPVAPHGEYGVADGEPDSVERLNDRLTSGLYGFGPLTISEPKECFTGCSCGMGARSEFHTRECFDRVDAGVPFPVVACSVEAIPDSLAMAMADTQANGKESDDKG